MHRLHLLETNLPLHDWRYWRRQGLALLALFLGMVLCLPGVPGPGFVFLILGVVLADFPSKHRLVEWVRHKRWFRRVRAYLRIRWNLLILLGPSDKRDGKDSPS